MRKAFTIAELLTVVLILSILMSLLFPVFGKTKGRAETIECISNMHQIYTAVMLYESDMGVLPPNILSSPGLEPYYKKILECPAAPKDLMKYGSGGYIYYGFFDPKNPVYPAWEECKEVRGPAMPIIFDDNHKGNEQANATGQSFFLLTRWDGSTHKVDTKWAVSQLGGHAPLPCVNPPSWEMNF